MLYLRKSSPFAIHIILEAFASAAMATLASHDIAIDAKDKWED
jgi:hypothetical protein